MLMTWQIQHCKKTTVLLKVISRFNVVPTQTPTFPTENQKKKHAEVPMEPQKTVAGEAILRRKG